jgi:hypothetical protein
MLVQHNNLPSLYVPAMHFGIQKYVQVLCLLLTSEDASSTCCSQWHVSYCLHQQPRFPQQARTKDVNINPSEVKNRAFYRLHQHFRFLPPLGFWEPIFMFNNKMLDIARDCKSNFHGQTQNNLSCNSLMVLILEGTGLAELFLLHSAATGTAPSFFKHQHEVRVDQWPPLPLFQAIDQILDLLCHMQLGLQLRIYPRK